MKFTWIYILPFAAIIVSCVPVDKIESTSDTAGGSELKKDREDGRLETLESLDDSENQENDLPILPPIILIDFTNGTNLTSEEKAKRTVNGNLGYGFQPNNLFSGKYNYYFPAGKSGTTVSIEESISPFLPTTIIEKENNQQSQSQSHGFGQRIRIQKPAPSSNENFQSYSRPLQLQQSQNFVGYSTPKPTNVDIRSNRFSNGLGNYRNPNQNYQSYSSLSSSSSSSPSFSSSSPSPLPSQYTSTSIQQQYQPLSSGLTKSYNSPAQNYDTFAQTRLPPVYQSPSFSQRQESLSSYSTPTNPPLQNYPSQAQTTLLSPVDGTPKYSYQDGIKYEHKIVWRYPNGMVSDIPPNSYPEYSTQDNAALTQQNFQSPGAGFPPNADNEGIYSQKPATFPQDDSPNGEDSKPSQFVSSASISDATNNNYSPTVSPALSQKYSFQNPYSISGTNGQFPKSQELSGLVKSTFENPKTLSSYPIDSPEAEFPGLRGYATHQVFDSANHYGANQASSYKQPQNSGSSPSSGRLQPNIQLAKYSPQVQQYLKKALKLGESGVKTQEYDTPTNTDLRYSNLLDYNPSISQYIGNPSSILNAQPTFIQAGNSLIPVIILRVDGVPPIEPKPTPNINLKALLQKYLTQYAQTVTSLTQGGGDSSQDYGAARAQASRISGLESFDLGELTRGLDQLGRTNPNFKQNFAQNFAQSIAQSTQTGYQPVGHSVSSKTSYGEEFKKTADGKYGASSQRESTTRKPKVKSVEIIEDPRFTSYKVKN